MSSTHENSAKGMYRNPEFFYVQGDNDITVSVTFSASPSCDDQTLMKNAAEAIGYFASNGQHKSWTKRVEVQR